jgi:hypothetical protein
MNKNDFGVKASIVTIFIVIVLVAALSLVMTSCTKPAQPGNLPGNDVPLFNQSINTQIENLTDISKVPEVKKYVFTYVPRNNTKYEVAKDDFIMLSKGNFTSTEISVLGIKLGDSADDVRKTIGVPDTEFIAADKSYRNIEYGRRIGINSTDTAITFHIENGTVTQINLRRLFNKYLQGNSTIGKDKNFVYAYIGIPDYQDFLANHKVFHYVEKGMNLYVNMDDVDAISFQMPKVFKGVKYVTRNQEIAQGIYGNVTEAVLIE